MPRHGFATLALATAAGGLGARRVDEIRAQVRGGLAPTALPFAERNQVGVGTRRAPDGDRAGQGHRGWYYEPVDTSHEGSMTVTQIAGLRAAMEAGVAATAP